MARHASSHAYQKTLRLPKTKFPNRSNLQKTFDQLLPESSQNIYKDQYQALISKLNALEGSSDDAKLEFLRENVFILHDGPPYANGDLHLGHALNKILKDMINRVQLINGKHVVYIPGWDCHGLPIELKALNQLSDRLDTISATKIRSIARKHAEKTVKIQKKQFEEFAILADWDHKYLTMNREYELDQLAVFQELYKKNLIKRQRKPVYWGTETKTALAEGELEYKDDHVSVSAYVKFPLTRESKEMLGVSSMPISLLIWTSTPWTLFSNRAICFNENFVYALVKFGEELLIIEKNLLESMAFMEGYELVKEIEGYNLQNLKYTNPLLSDDVERPLFHGAHVISSTGTGLVHTAPGHGHDDYLVGLLNGLEIFSPVDHEGRYILEELPAHLHELLSESEDQARKVIEPQTTEAVISLLEKKKMLLHKHRYVHSYPYDWRSKKPVIIRSTPQWFADLHDVKTLASNSLGNVRFVPERGSNRLASFIKTRNEWCISRQRYWGVPIPTLHKRDNPDEVLMDEETVAHIIDQISKEGIDSWFSESTPESMSKWLPVKYQNVATQYYRGGDTIDVWFDSGSSWNVISNWYKRVAKLENKLPVPLADVYLEGSDQHRGWFQSSLLTKVASNGNSEAPFKTVITHGFTLDENGIKMSKSIGNTISPKAIIEGDAKQQLPPLGVDGLRLLVAQSDFTSDLVVGPTVMKHVADALKKFRLTFKFLLGNLQETTSHNLISFHDLRRVDQYTLLKLHMLTEETKGLYQDFKFSNVLTQVQYHMNNELSALYFNVIKDSLYSDGLDSEKRLKIQTTLFHILDAYRGIMAPIIPIMVQEAWNYLPTAWYLNKGKNSLSTINSPMTRKLPELSFVPESATDILSSFGSNELAIMRAFNEKFNSLEEITKTVQIKCTVYCNEPSKLPFSSEDLEDLLQVASLVIVKGEHPELPKISLESNEIQLLLEESNLHKCPRCWKYNSTNEGTLCQRCDEVVNK